MSERADLRRCGVMDCTLPAMFHIQGLRHFEDEVAACRLHVGEMLTTPEWLQGDNYHWNVALIDGVPEVGEDQTWFVPAGGSPTRITAAEFAALARGWINNHPAEALTVLLPDIDWQALREAVETDVTVTNHHDAYGSPYAVADMIADDAWRVFDVARRLLAVYDGKDEG